MTLSQTIHCAQRVAGAVVFAAVVGLLLPGCSTNPATGQSQLNFLSKDQEVAMGEQNAPEVLKELGGEIPSKTIQDHVSQIGMQMAKLSERSDLPWAFYVVDSEVINAFALPGGKIFITRGLISKMDNDAQLAAVLGHEVGHVTAQHAGQQMAHNTIVGLGAAGVGIGAGYATDEEWVGTAAGAAAGLAATGLVLRYSRSHESQADSLGLRYMTKAGYNPIGMVQLMEILHKEAAGGAMPEFMLTHPLPETRIRNVEAEIVKDYPGYDQPGRYKMGFDSFKQNVAVPLANLPAPKVERLKQEGN